MDLMAAIGERRSIRKFLPDPVDETDLKEIIQAGTLAINAENKQMWYFVAVTNKELIEKVGDAVSDRVDSITNACRTIGKGEALANHKYFMTFFRYAPAVIAVFTCPYVGVVEESLGNLNMAFKRPAVRSRLSPPVKSSLCGFTAKAFCLKCSNRVATERK